MVEIVLEPPRWAHQQNDGRYRAKQILTGTLSFNSDGSATLVINGHIHTFSF